MKIGFASVPLANKKIAAYKTCPLVCSLTTERRFEMQINIDHANIKIGIIDIILILKALAFLLIS
jgi:hypothetical protein